MGRFPRLRLLAHAATGGALLSCLRAPLGLDWTQLVAVQATSAALFRAAALFALALTLDAGRPALSRGPGPLWLAGLAAGYVGHGLVLELTPGSRAGYALWLLAGTLLARWLAGPRGAKADPSPEPLRRWERAGLALAGAGAAIALESLAREARLFTMGTAADESIVGAAFLVLVAVGALAFGPLLARAGGERIRTSAGLAASGAAVFAGLFFLSVLSPDGLHGYLRRFDVLLGGLRGLDERLGGRLGLAGRPTLDGASIGTPWTTAILASAAWVLPGFVLGGTLGASSSFARVRVVVLGAGLGLLALPHLAGDLGAPLSAAEFGTVAFAWTLAAIGVSLGGAGLALSSASGAPLRRSDVAGMAVALGVVVLPWVAPRRAVWSFSPWSAKRVDPELVWPLAEGLLTVEPAAGGGKLVTLDRRRVTPLLEEEAADGRRLRASWALLPSEKRAEGARMLLVGQLTPHRAAVLASLGVRTLDRTAAWHRAMPAVEATLFPLGPPPGSVLSPARARAGLGEGAYDWVVATQAWGPIVTWKSEAREIWGSIDGPRLTDLELGSGAIGVAWIPGDARLEAGTEFAPLLVTIERLERLSLGLVRGSFEHEPASHGPLFRLQGPRRPGALAFLGTMPQQRQFELQRATTGALTCPASPALARALAVHFGAQQLSSPYESRAQQIEVDEEALRILLTALPAELDPLTTEIWEAVAWLCREKRLPEQALAFLGPVADRYAPWVALDRSLASAYREMLDPDSALRVLERARAARPEDLWLWLESAGSAEERGSPELALKHLQGALSLPVVRTPDQERALGLALVRLGDGRGRPMLEKRLLEAPDDLEVREALGLPPLEPGE